MVDAPVEVLLVDGHQIFAELLGRVLGGLPTIRYVGHAATAEQAVRLAGLLRPDVVLLDLELSGGDGAMIIERLLAVAACTRVVALTDCTDPVLVAQAAGAGASGLLTKGGPLGEILRAVQTAHSGRMTVNAELLGRLLSRRREPTPASAGGLTGRESQVLRLMNEGVQTAAIARRLGISLHTCRGYVRSMMAKLEVEGTQPGGGGDRATWTA